MTKRFYQYRATSLDDAVSAYKLGYLVDTSRLNAHERYAYYEWVARFHNVPNE